MRTKAEARKHYHWQFTARKNLLADFFQYDIELTHKLLVEHPLEGIPNRSVKTKGRISRYDCTDFMRRTRFGDEVHYQFFNNVMIYDRHARINIGPVFKD